MVYKKFNNINETPKEEEGDSNDVSSDNHLLHKKQKKVIINDFTLYLNDIDDDSGFVNILKELWNAGPDDKLTIRINSYGGFISMGMELTNIMEQFGKRVNTIIESNAMSMAAIMFCLGSERTVYEHSTIMFHNYSGGHWGKGHENKAALEHETKVLRKYFKRIIGSFLEDDEFDDMVEKGVDFWFDTEQMCTRGIATHVIVDGKRLTTKDYLKLNKN